MLISSISHFFIAVVKYLTRSKVREKGLILTHLFEKIQLIMARKTWGRGRTVAREATCSLLYN